MLYVSDLDKFYETKTITSFELNPKRIELIEISSNYFIISYLNNIVKNVSSFEDLRLALDTFHHLIESNQDLNLH